MKQLRFGFFNNEDDSGLITKLALNFEHGNVKVVA